MKKLFMILLAGAAVLAVSCNKEGMAPGRVSSWEQNGAAADEEGIPVIFDLGDMATKAGPSETVTSTLQSSGFYVLASTGTAGNSAETTSPGFASTKFTYSSSKYSGGKYWPATNPNYHFYAASKALTLSSGAVTFKPSATIADDVYAYLATPTFKSSNALTFNHIYAQVGTCNITAPSGYTVSNLSVTITPKVPTANATFNVRTGAWSTTASHYTNGSAVTLCTATGSTTDNDLWLVPGSYTLTASYTLIKGAYSESFTKTSTVSLVMGKNNNISAQLPPGTAADIVFTVTVTGWTDNAITASWN